jgi:hypothetical protein
MSNLRTVATTVVRRAERQGYVVSREIRAELTAAGLPEGQWKEVVALARTSLNYRSGRYHYIRPVSPRLQQAEDQRAAIRQAIGRFLDSRPAPADQDDRRHEDRVNLVQPVRVRTEDGREGQMLCRDLSPTGIRLIGNRSLLGQKIQVVLPLPDGSQGASFLVRVLWTAAVADGLFDNGGTFLELLTPDPS